MTDKKQYTLPGIFAGAFLGGLAGGVTMLLLTPQSGENMRLKIREKSIEYLDNLLGQVENAATQMHSDYKKRLVHGAHQKNQRSTKQGRATVDQRSNYTTGVAQSKHKAIHNVSLASPDEGKDVENIDNLVERQPIANNVVNDSLGG